MIPIKTIIHQLKLPHDRDVRLLELYLGAAIAMAERYTETVIRLRELTSKFDCFAESLPLQCPAVSVTEVAYFDSDNALQVLPLANIELVNESKTKCYIEPAYGYSWPAVAPRKRAVTVRYSAGYTPNTLPEDLKIALLSLIAHIEQNPELAAPVQLYEIPMSCQFILGQLEVPSA